MDIPGYYYDAAVRRYFKGKASKPAPINDSHASANTMPVCWSTETYELGFNGVLSHSGLFPKVPFVLCKPELWAVSLSGRRLVVTDHVSIDDALISEVRPTEISRFFITESRAVLVCGTDLDYRKRSYIIGNPMLVLDVLVTHIAGADQGEFYVATSADEVMLMTGNWSHQFNARILGLCLLDDLLVVSTLGSKLHCFKNGRKISTVHLPSNANTIVSIDHCTIVMLIAESVYFIDTRYAVPFLFLSNSDIVKCFAKYFSEPPHFISLGWDPFRQLLYTWSGCGILAFKLDNLIPAAAVLCHSSVARVYPTIESVFVQCQANC